MSDRRFLALSTSRPDAGAAGTSSTMNAHVLIPVVGINGPTVVIGNSFSRSHFLKYLTVWKLKEHILNSYILFLHFPTPDAASVRIIQPKRETATSSK